MAARVRYANGISYKLSHWGISSNTNLSSNPFYVTTVQHHCYNSSSVLASSSSLHDSHAAATTLGSTTPVLILLNPTDCRGWRMIVTVTAHDAAGGIASTFNRPPTPREAVALSSVLSLLAQCVLPTLGMLGQTFVAGNNCHHLDGTSGDMVIGTEEEMSLIHGHVVARGPPGFSVNCVDLLGPAVGEEFALRGPKVPWNMEELPSVVAFIREAVTAELGKPENSIFGISQS